MTETNQAALTLTMPSDREIVVMRVFDAPRQLVFDAVTQPQHLAQWWGPRRFTLVLCEIDLRVGGAWRFVQRNEDGSEYGFRGVYQEVAAPERLVYTEEFEGMPGHDYLITMTLTEQDGKTTFTGTILYKSKEDRDGHFQSGMEAGMRESYDRLAELLAREVAKADSR